MKKILTGLAICLSVIVVAITFYLASKLPISTDTDVYIPIHTSVTKAVDNLRQEKVISSPSFFSFMVKSVSFITRKGVHAGTYRFSPKNTHYDVMRAVITGKQTLMVKVTFPEGITTYRFASILSRKANIDSAKFIRLVFNDSVVKSFGIHAPSLEGYLFPNTFEINWKEPAESILEYLVTRQLNVWAEFDSEAKKQGRSQNDVMTLASIIEAETPQPDERARVSGVYFNRLRKGMKLDADPTVQYAFGQRKRLYYKDLEIESPYNTYRYAGLPPGPINSPSKSSIEAALHPEQHSYIFFVAKGDESNTHSFATSDIEHQRNVLKYRANRAKRLSEKAPS